MNNFLDALPLQPKTSPAGSIIRLILVLILGMFVAQFIAAITVLPIVGFNIKEFEAALSNPADHPKGQMVLIVSQAVSSIFTFIIFPIAYLRMGEKQQFSQLSPVWRMEIQDVLAVVIIMISFLIVDARIILWNESITFPESLRGLEEMMRGMEDKLAASMETLTKIESPVTFIILLFVMAVVPGIGEELVFRGLLQNYLHRLTKNPHIAIWVAALIFSGIHLQFYGFVPRVLLGALFGYLYVITGRLSVAMFAHFVNNALTLLGVYLQQTGAIEGDTNTPEKMPWGTTIVAGMVFIAVMMLYYSYQNKRKLSE